jgi:hypothetical protein
LKVIDKINPAVRHNESAATRPLKRQIGVEDVDSIEVELGIEAALDVLGFAKPMLLASEGGCKNASRERGSASGQHCSARHQLAPI